MISFFCVNCGTKVENNTTKGMGDFSVSCVCCGIGFNFDIVVKPSRSLEEADQVFQQTKLTDSQRGSKRRLIPFKK